RPLRALLREVRVKGMAHITGGGLIENVPRVLPDGVAAAFDTGSWTWPALFRWLQEAGGIETREMHTTFNCGVGLVLAVAEADAPRALEVLAASGERAWVIGQAAERRGEAVTFS